MPYEVFQKKTARIGSPAVTFTSKNRVMLNSFAARILHKNAVEFVLLLWDRENRKVAVRPITKKDSRSYKLSYGRNQNGCGFAAKSFMDYIGWKSDEKQSFPARWNEEEEILEFSLATEQAKEDQQHKLLAVGAAKRQSRLG
jgi:hypothetical protein